MGSSGVFGGSDERGLTEMDAFLGLGFCVLEAFREAREQVGLLEGCSCNYIKVSNSFQRQTWLPTF